MINATSAPVHSVLWALSAPHLPPVAETHRLAHLARQTAMATAGRLLGADAVPPTLHGHHARERPRGNPHAHFLPVDLDGDGRIDGLLVHAPGGFCSASLLALCASRRLYDGRGLMAEIEVAALGPDALHASRLGGPARRWRSLTPWVRGDRFDKKGWGLAQQIEDDLRCRQWPAAATVTLLSPDGPPFRLLPGRPPPRNPGTRQAAIDTIRLDSEDAAPPLWGRRLLLCFSTTLIGPLTLGWEAHFGLGLFEPLADPNCP